MEIAKTNAETSFIKKLIMLPFAGLWFLIRHPIVFIFMFLLLVFGSISFLANFNPAIAERFSNAAHYFGAATVVDMATDGLRRKISALDLEIKHKKEIILRRNAALKEASSGLEYASEELRKSSKALKIAATDIDSRSVVIREHNRRLGKFRAAGKRVEAMVTKRFSKVAIYDATGEFMGWLPIIGDAASIGLTAGGMYEMCQMFKEIELATKEFGVAYQVYTDTFCEKPVEKTKEIIAEKTGKIKGKIVASTTVFKEYAAGVPVPDKDSMTKPFQRILDLAYKLMRRLYNAI